MGRRVRHCGHAAIRLRLDSRPPPGNRRRACRRAPVGGRPRHQGRADPARRHARGAAHAAGRGAVQVLRQPQLRRPGPRGNARRRGAPAVRDRVGLPPDQHRGVGSQGRGRAAATRAGGARQRRRGADAAGRRHDTARQLQALDVVLYFFAGVALFVGGFLILNAFNMTVLQRTRELGMLRTLGATRRMVKRTVLLEALVLGVVGSLLGLGLGLGLAVGLTQLMKGFGIPVGNLSVGLGPAVIAVITGLIATFTGAYWPARRAGRIAPIRAVLGQRSESGARHRAARGIAGLVLFLPGAIFGGSLWMNNTTSGALSGLLATLLTMAMFVGMVSSRRSSGC
ncbi:MAG: ABC transporter permease [Actinobacteria bacterium]|nr:MAG: ABC transporter permease [Actinomycetota bacterium]